MKLNLPVMAMLLGGAAALQVLLPPLPGTLLKAQLIVAVVIYYALSREASLGLLAAAWAGLLLDALGGLPAGLSTVTLLLLAGGLLAGRAVLGESWLTAAAIGMVVTALLLFVQWLTLRSRCIAPPPAGAAAAGIGLATLAGGLLAPLGRAVGSVMDRWAGNISVRQEVGGGS